MKHLVGYTKDETPVYVDLIRSKAADHIAQSPYLLGLVRETLRQATIRGSKLSLEQDMGRDIGYSFVVETTETDVVFYAQLVHDDTYTRFVKNGKPLSTQHITLNLQRNTDKSYELHDAWIGHTVPPRPGSTDETASSKGYWANHAVIPNNQALQPRTITKVCPY